MIELVNPNGATLSGTTTRTSVNGIATFDDLFVDRVGDYQFKASSPGFESEDSSTFEITPAATNSVSFATQPSDALPNQALAPAVQVQQRQLRESD